MHDPDVADDFRQPLTSESKPYDIQSWIQRNGTYVTALIVERNVMRLILFIVVIITALNIITGVLMLVKNKARDVAILRTIGATRGGRGAHLHDDGNIPRHAGRCHRRAARRAVASSSRPIQHFLEGAASTFELFPPDIYMLDALPAKLEWAEVTLGRRRRLPRDAGHVDHSVDVGGAAQSGRSAQVRMMDASGGNPPAATPVSCRCAA